MVGKVIIVVVTLMMVVVAMTSQRHICHHVGSRHFTRSLAFMGLVSRAKHFTIRETIGLGFLVGHQEQRRCPLGMFGSEAAVDMAEGVGAEVVAQRGVGQQHRQQQPAQASQTRQRKQMSAGHGTPSVMGW